MKRTVNKWPNLPEKKPDHGIGWLVTRTALFLLIGFLSVFGLMYVIPFYTWIAGVDQQATAFILLAGLCCAFGCVWLFAKVTNRL
jgi:hypothetical protein